jgi:hypothetical protein
MKKTIAILITILSLTTAATAADGSYDSGELSLSLFGGWIDKEDSTFAPGVGMSYFLTRRFGVGAYTQWENFDGTFFDNVSAEGYFRLPLGDSPIAPYALAAIGYSFETDEVFEAVGAGAEWRFNEKWGAFGDVRWQFNNDTDDGTAVRIGVRLKF